MDLTEIGCECVVCIELAQNRWPCVTINAGNFSVGWVTISCRLNIVLALSDATTTGKKLVELAGNNGVYPSSFLQPFADCVLSAPRLSFSSGNLLFLPSLLWCTLWESYRPTYFVRMYDKNNLFAVRIFLRVFDKFDIRSEWVCRICQGWIYLRVDDTPCTLASYSININVISLPEIFLCL
jgi:hypothetical protein